MEMSRGSKILFSNLSLGFISLVLDLRPHQRPRAIGTVGELEPLLHCPESIPTSRGQGSADLFQTFRFAQFSKLLSFVPEKIHHITKTHTSVLTSLKVVHGSENRYHFQVLFTISTDIQSQLQLMQPSSFTTSTRVIHQVILDSLSGVVANDNIK